MKAALAIFLAAIVLAAGCVAVAVAGNDGSDEPECSYNGNCNPADDRKPTDGGEGDPNQITGPGA